MPAARSGVSASPALGSSDTGRAPLPIWLLRLDERDGRGAGERLRHRRQQALRQRGDLVARARQQPQRRQPRGEAVGIGIEAQHRLERGEADLVEAQGPLQRVLRQRRDQIGAADDEAGLRPAEQLVAAEGDEIGAGLERLGDGRLVRQAPAVEIDQRAAAEILDQRQAVRDAPAPRAAPPGPRR